MQGANIMEQKALSLRVKGLEDIVRMAASMTSMGQPTYIVRFRSGDCTIYGVVAVFRDYYKYYGLPLFYYYPVKDDDKEDKNYVCIRSDETGERIVFSKGPKPGYVTVAIVNLESPPEFLEELEC